MVRPVIILLILIIEIIVILIILRIIKLTLVIILVIKFWNCYFILGIILIIIWYVILLNKSKI
jgi:hypothetical protein